MVILGLTKFVKSLISNEYMETGMIVQKETYEAPLVECLEMELESGCMVSSVNASGNETWGTESGSWAEQW